MFYIFSDLDKFTAILAAIMGIGIFALLDGITGSVFMMQIKHHQRKGTLR
ncbi:MAG: hypothetical protein JW841_09115 [Deltaproteobacteria bacterium]|nr:hypothetical protein [Deltaproteobacteria bacterium]